MAEDQKGGPAGISPAMGRSLHLFPKKVWIPALAATVILILIYAPLLFKKNPSLQDQSVVEYVESKDYNVMVYETEKGKVTVIWLFEGPEEESPAS